ncbi:MAG: hypothetical protein JNK47_03945 [Mesorhizobium sp.]|nr:hypothetical protein [Mesorhizobium sp.]MBL8576354.1 hypothetical protein [Mesorhizobium sp.]
MNLPRIRAPRQRAAASNGKRLVPGIDMRSAHARRMHDLIAGHVADMGGNVSQAQYALIKTAANIQMSMEAAELQFSQQEGGATFPQMLAYGTMANSLRRTYESLGIDKAPPAPPQSSGEVWTAEINNLSTDERKETEKLIYERDELGPLFSDLKAGRLKQLIAKLYWRGFGPSKEDKGQVVRHDKDLPYDEIDWDYYHARIEARLEKEQAREDRMGSEAYHKQKMQMFGNNKTRTIDI